MIGFDELERGDIVWATDPLSEKGRPMLVLATPRFSAHGVQLITTLLTTKTYHEESLALSPDEYEAEPLGEQSDVLPWSLATLTEATAVETRLTSLTEERTDDVAAQVATYISG